MANPTSYSPGYSFSGWQSSNPTLPLPADKVDSELANIAVAVNSAGLAVQDVRRSDGKLVNQIVTADSLAADVRGILTAAGATLRGGWVTATAYAVKDVVSANAGTYICVTAHVADAAFATDLDAGRWLLVASPYSVSGAVFTQLFSGNGSSTDFTLSQPFSSITDILVFVQPSGGNGYELMRMTGGSPQVSLPASTTLRFATAPASGSNNILALGINSAAASAATGAVTAAAEAEASALLAEAEADAAAASASSAASSAATATAAVLTVGVPSLGVFTGTGVQTAFTLPATPPSTNAIMVFVGGVHQERTKFSYSGTTLTFVTAPPNGAPIQVVIGASLNSTSFTNTVGTAEMQDGALSADTVGRLKMADLFVTARKESDDAWSSVASASTVDLGAINSRNALITGTTTITSFGNTGGEGRTIRVRLGGALTLTHNATSLILPSGANITTAAGDVAEFVKESGTGNWRCTDYQRASGQSIVVPAAGLVFLSAQTASASATVDFTTGISATYDEYEIHFDAVVPASANANILARVTTNAGSTWESTNYRGTELGWSGTVTALAGAPTDAIYVTVRHTALAGISTTAADGGASGIVRFRPNNSSGKKNTEILASYIGNTPAMVQSFCSGQWNGANTVLNGIRFLMNTGNIASGTFRLYGVQRV
jgi:hypothetical protein